jgi:beta-fructofuranosidase
LDLRLYLDGAVLEVFAGEGRVTVTRAMDLPLDGLVVEALAYGGSARLTAYDRWEMASIW